MKHNIFRGLNFLMASFTEGLGNLPLQYVLFSVDESEYVCTECPRGFAGARCERCDTGFFGNPLKVT